jgi:hypothetical protein
LLIEILETKGKLTNETKFINNKLKLLVKPLKYTAISTEMLSLFFLELKIQCVQKEWN